MKDVLALILLLFSSSLGKSQDESEIVASQEPVGSEQYVDEPIAGGAGDDFYYEEGQDANKGKDDGFGFHSVKPSASNKEEDNQELGDGYEYEDNTENSRSSKVMHLKTSQQNPKGEEIKRGGANRKRSPQKRGDEAFGEDPNFDDALRNNDEIYDYIPDDAIEKHDKPASSVKQEEKVKTEIAQSRKQFRSEILPSKQTQNYFLGNSKEETGEASSGTKFVEDNVDKSNLYGDLATREKRDGTDPSGASSNNTATNTKSEDVKKESTPTPAPAQSSAAAKETSSKGSEKEIRYLGGGVRGLRRKSKNGITHLGGRSGFGGLTGRSSNDIIQLGDNADIDFGGYGGKTFGSSRNSMSSSYLRNGGNMRGRSFGAVRTGFLHNGARGLGSGLGGRSFSGGRRGFGGGISNFQNRLGGRSGITRLNGRSKKLQLRGRKQQVGGEILDVKIKKRDESDPAFKKCKEMCTSQPDYKGGKICGFLEIKEGIKEKVTGLQWAWYRNQCERRCDMAERVGKRQCKWLGGQQGGQQGGNGSKPKPRPIPGSGINPGSNPSPSPAPPTDNTSPSPSPGDPSPAPAPNPKPDPGPKPKDALATDDDENDY